MKIRRGHLYVVDFNPRVKTKAGKIRPAVVVQDDLVNEAGYPSTIVLPTTTRLADTGTPLRLRLPVGTAGLDHESDVLVAQVIAVANESFRRELGVLPVDLAEALDAKLRAVMGL
ncbi:MAG: type II toxin-antitoxin system PemK/MazF family toxin [Deltaproteobacteria bacterium]|nr:MAG: type II toxin-antitoxin system PemK/MazF family toxin [Deltaproteobacteria bacterium]TMA99996.1 MAG: type II toxin-antitoxin system PemK/MazF family toxin [Deltaproteobacteria bacterium]